MATSIFTQGGGEVISSYSWEDIRAGMGYQRYYSIIGSLTDGGVGENYQYYLSPQIIDSVPISLAKTRSGAGTETFDLDFDTTFNKPSYVSGDALVNFSHFMNNGSNSGSVYFTINVYHVDLASSETLLGTATTPTRPLSGAVTATWRESCRITLTPKHFGRGEKLRFNIYALITHGGTGTTSTTIYFDATGGETSVGSGIRGDCFLDLPFKIEL